MADPNTRTGKRTPVTLKIKFKSETLEQFIERYAVDVSQGGIFIRTKEPLAVGTQMRFEFQLRDASPLIGGEGTVVWTRENDPSRPAIAPGMGVRFDRLAEGSQAVLERILAEKAKQAPNRPASDSIRPPLFTDMPTRVAPAPMQEQLLNTYKAQAARRAEEDQHTPLPKPMPFATDADEFPDEAFEEATKVRALDELVAQTADSAAASAALAEAAPPAPPAPSPADELAERRTPKAGPTGGRTPVAEPEVPGLPSPPETNAAKPAPRTDATPSSTPATLTDSPSAKTKLGGLEAPRMQTPAATSASGSGPGPGPSVGGPMSQALGGGSGRAVETDATPPVRPTPTKSSAPLAILLLVLLAAGAAGVWFFFLRNKGPGVTTPPIGTASGSSATGSGSGVGSGSAPAGGSDQMSGTGSNAATTPDEPKQPLAETLIEANIPKARVEVAGTDQTGDAPFTVKLEKDKLYKVRVTARGYVTHEADLVGGEVPKHTATLVVKPRVLSIKTTPPGAVISIDGVQQGGKVTPQEIELTKAQAAKKSLKVRMFKNGYKLLEKTITADSYTDEDTRMAATIDETLQTQAAAVRPPGTGSGATTPTGPGPGAGSGTPSGGSTTPPPDTTPPPPPPPPAGGGSADPPSS